MSPEVTQKRLSKEQKTGFVLLLLFGLMAIMLAFLQMRHNLYAPFIEQKIVSNLEAKPVYSFFDDQTRLQQIDTDQDGLNNYEEIQFYQTSAYIPDTDSDGIDDKTEIEQGTDPLCPEGDACDRFSASGPASSVSSSSISPLIDTADTPSDIFGGAVETVQDTIPEETAPPQELIDLVTSDPNYVRQLLRSSGQISEAELNQFDDQTLLDLAAQLVAEYQSGELDASASVQ